MKKLYLALTFVFICLFASVFVGCNSNDDKSTQGNDTPPANTTTESGSASAKDTLAFNEKYYYGDSYLIFKEDKTGAYHREYTGSSTEALNSYSILFLWEEASDNSIHLFFDHVEYDSEHTDKKNITKEYLLQYPLFYAEDFMYYEYYAAVIGRTTCIRYIRGNSSLYALEN